MLAARLHGTRDIRIHREPPPEPLDAEPLIRVTAVGLCGSDRHWFLEASIGDAVIDRPLALGHEFSGVVETGPRKGQRVAVDPSLPCFACGACLAGNHNLCPHVKFSGHGPVDGALREYVVWPDHCLYEVPDSMSDEEAALVEPLAVGLHAIDLGKVRPGMRVGVFGCGPIGLLLIGLLNAAGATEVIATDPLPHRVAAARRLGAAAVETDGVTDPGALQEVLRGGEVDVSFDAAGSNEAVDTAMSTVRVGGRVVLVGVPDGDLTTFRASTARRKGLTLVMARRSKPIFERVIRLFERQRLDVGWLAGDLFPLERTAEAFETLADRSGLKVIVKPTGQ